MEAHCPPMKDPRESKEEAARPFLVPFRKLHAITSAIFCLLEAGPITSKGRRIKFHLWEENVNT